jgi:hypothetical protein
MTLVDSVYFTTGRHGWVVRVRGMRFGALMTSGVFGDEDHEVLQHILSFELI